MIPKTDSFKFALKGIVELFKTQRNAQFHLVAAIIVVSLGAYFNITASEWLFIVLAIMAVLSAEGLNTAIEWLGDEVHRTHNQTVGRAKDVAAGAVLITAGGAAIIGFIIFIPYFLNS